MVSPRETRRRLARARRRRRLYLPAAALGLMAVVVVIYVEGRGAGRPAGPPPSSARSASPTMSPARSTPSVSPAASPGRPSLAGSPEPALPPAIVALRPGPDSKSISGPRSLPVPVLMYHVLAATPADAPYPALYVAPQSFVAQLRWLRDHGYQAVTLRRVHDFWRGRGTLPAHPVVLTFDDGYRCDYTVAAPLLHALGWPGVLNLRPASVGAHQALSKSMVDAMIAAGWEIGAHSLTHPDLTTVDAARLREEVAGSRKALRTMFGVPVDFFCYPSGRYDATVEAAVKAAGYLGATTTDSGFATPADPYALRRVRVDGGETIEEFAALLEEAAQ